VTGSAYYGFRFNRLITGASLKARRSVYNVFANEFGACRRILDVGATSESESPDANFLEVLHPHKDRITAAGVEDASHLERVYPGMRFVRIEPNAPLPFRDDEFDVAYSHAVIEHVVGERERRFFLSELWRVARAIFVTTPNKFFPIEPHTCLPLIHWVSDAAFYRLAAALGSFYNRDNLRLLTRRELSALAEGRPHEVRSVKLFGMTSNYILIARKTASV